MNVVRTVRAATHRRGADRVNGRGADRVNRRGADRVNDAQARTDRVNARAQSGSAARSPKGVHQVTVHCPGGGAQAVSPGLQRVAQKA